LEYAEWKQEAGLVPRYVSEAIEIFCDGWDGCADNGAILGMVSGRLSLGVHGTYECDDEEGKPDSCHCWEEDLERGVFCFMFALVFVSWLFVARSI
jgi:hypothetical protein